ncbi:hypothetical protein [Flavobacterium sp. ZS1P14]|uniref:hypothetical protein n=1 Tax=Flavobacterium sp. ZS1P14 TaxID=3401729 RepID=UPI003AAC7BD3
MKNKLYIAGLASMLLLTYSCSNDDSYEVQEVKAKSFEITPQAALNAKIIDSTSVKAGTKIISTQINIAPPEDGDPANPIPPR